MLRQIFIESNCAWVAQAKEERDKAAAGLTKLQKKLKPIDEEMRKYNASIERLQKNVENYVSRGA